LFQDGASAVTASFDVLLLFLLVFVWEKFNAMGVQNTCSINEDFIFV
jgi:hypothetical protein